MLNSQMSLIQRPFSEISELKVERNVFWQPDMQLPSVEQRDLNRLMIFLFLSWLPWSPSSVFPAPFQCFRSFGFLGYFLSSLYIFNSIKLLRYFYFVLLTTSLIETLPFNVSYHKSFGQIKRIYKQINNYEQWLLSLKTSGRL